jgi:hypothetical protein
VSVSNGPEHPQPDFTYDAALKQAQRDYARLMHLHDLSWRVDVACKRVYVHCSCDDMPRTPSAVVDHILASVKSARGPKPIAK